MEMNKMKRLVLFISVSLLSCLIAFPVFAENQQSSATLKIEDPVTQETWSWNIAPEDVIITDSGLSRTAAESKLHRAEVKVNLADYLPEVLASTESGSSTIDRDVILTAGMTYSYSETDSVVTVYNVFGSTQGQGLYYATNREVHWRHPGAGVYDNAFYPTANSWNQSVYASGYYESSLLSYPHCLLKCDVHISGMTSYKEASLEFHLNYL